MLIVERMSCPVLTIAVGNPEETDDIEGFGGGIDESEGAFFFLITV